MMYMGLLYINMFMYCMFAFTTKSFLFTSVKFGLSSHLTATTVLTDQCEKSVSKVTGWTE